MAFSYKNIIFKYNTPMSGLIFYPAHYYLNLIKIIEEKNGHSYAESRFWQIVDWTLFA